MYISGESVRTEGKLEERSPIDRNVLIGIFQNGTKDHASLAVSKAKAALPEWSKTPYRERAAVLRKAAEILSARKFTIAAELSYENGKSRYESVGEVDEGIDFLRYYADEMESNRGFTRRNAMSGSAAKGAAGFQGAPSSEKIIISLRPLGVFAVIAPFNFPISISIGMSSAAIVTGNTVVFKPSSSDNMSMLSGLRIYEIFKEAGLPEGVFNYITGPGSVVGAELIENPDVSGVAFTGSRQVGMSMLSRSVALGFDRHFVTEMSGKNPCIVSKGADLDVATNGIVSAAFGYAGQKCSALSRLYVHESLKDELTAKIISRARDLKIGNPIEKATYIGPLISQSAHKKYTDAIALASKSARILYGGNTVKTGLNGLYVEPAIIEAKHDSELVKRELFLPILTVESFSDINEAITMANDTEFGLTAGFYGGKRSEIKTFSERIEAGVVYINREISATTGAVVGMHTFVGWKGSSLTNKGSGSKHYLQQFMKEQSVSVSK